MIVTQITIRAGRTFNHPHEQFSNLRCDVEATATVAENESAADAIKLLQSRLEEAVEEHKNKMLTDIRFLKQKAELEKSIAKAEREIQEREQYLKSMREHRDNMTESTLVTIGVDDEEYEPDIDHEQPF